MMMQWCIVAVVVGMVCLVPLATSTCTPDDFDYNYDDVLYKSLLFFEAQRSGILPSTNQVPWRQSSAIDDALDSITNGPIDLEGGYYNDGRYMKYTDKMATTVIFLAWGALEYNKVYEVSGEMENVRKAVKWGTDYLLKAHVSSHELYVKVGDEALDNQYWGCPEEMTMDRPAFKITESNPGSDLAGETAAALAAASILFQNSNPMYSDTCRLQAKELYEFAANYTGGSLLVDYKAELALAATWLYLATQEAVYLTEAKRHLSTIMPLTDNNPPGFSLHIKVSRVLVLLVQLTEGAEQNTYINNLESFCDTIINEKPKTPNGLLHLGDQGTLGKAAAVSFVCLRTAELGINSIEYKEFGKQQIDYILGSSGRSFVVNFGNNPPLRPLHASSCCVDQSGSCSCIDINSNDVNPHVLSGALVSGPDINDIYKDVRNSDQNEVTILGNAGFQSAVAALRKLSCPTGASVYQVIEISSTQVEGQVNLNIPFIVDSLAIVINLSNPVTNVQVTNVSSNPTNIDFASILFSDTPNSITITYNNIIMKPEDQINIYFSADYSSVVPQITSIIFNGIQLEIP